MAKAYFVKKARKDFPEHDIKKGDSYWYWSFRFGGVHKSKTQPRPSQLTQSTFLSEIYSIQEEIESITSESVEDLESTVDEIKSRLEDLKSECENSLDNIPDQLKECDTGTLLQERIDGVDEWINNLDSLDLSIDEDIKEEEKKEKIEELIEEIKGCDPGYF